MTTLDVQELLKRGGYFGHRIARTNPKALPYTYKAQNDIYIIDLFKTKDCVERAATMLETAAKNNETILIVASKKLIKEYAKNLAQQVEIFYITEKWIGGFFTNFEAVHKNISRINTWITERDTGEWDGFIKHERVQLEKKLNKMLRVYEGVLKMDKLPDNIIIIDTKREHNALTESLKIKHQQELEEKRSINIVGIADTNADPTVIDYPIVINDDSTPTLEYILQYLMEVYDKGKKHTEKNEEKKEEKAPSTKETAKTEAKKPTAKKTAKKTGTQSKK